MSFALSLAAAQVRAQDEQTERYGWSADLGAEYSDNIARTETDKVNETTAIARFGIDLATKRPHFDADIVADLQYRDYLNRDIDSEISGGLDAFLDFAFVPERFSWIVEDNYGQINKDRSQADTANNREQINYLSTGPEITLPLGARTAVVLSGRYTDTYLEDSPQDNNATLGNIELIRKFSDGVSVSLNAGASKTEFDDPLFLPYKMRQASLELDLRGARTQLTASGGYAEWDQEGQPEVSKFTMFRVELSRDIGARSKLRLIGGTAPASTAENFRRDQTVIGIGDGPEAAQAANDIFRLDDAYIIWDTSWERTSITFVASARREKHELITSLDREQYRGDAYWSRKITRSLTWNAFGSYLQEQRLEDKAEFDEWSAGTSISWEFAQRFGLELRIDHFSGGSDDLARNYDENRVYLSVGYRGGRDGGRNGGGY
jgi:hypothetical protein